MTPERWKKIEELYHCAVEYTGEQRTKYLQTACAGDGQLFRELESLLAAANDSEDFLETPAAQLMARMMAEESLHPGQHLGAYTVISLIGAGGMGVVYRARDSQLARDVAIKVLPELFAQDGEYTTRFEREARLLAALNHKNIATIYGFEIAGGARALVMELIEGPTLADRIRSGPIPVDEVLRIASQIADALEYAHERGIVHRDLKPANIKISLDDAVKILDFGLAKAVRGESSEPGIARSSAISEAPTQPGVLMGTVAYMAPEQAKGRQVDRRADIWAFGCVLYEMLTARRAFSGETVAETLAVIMGGEPDSSLLPASTPYRVRMLLQRCLQRDPRMRLRDVGEARVTLEYVLSGKNDPGLAQSGEAAAPRLGHTLPWIFATCVAIAAAYLGWANLRGVEESPVRAAAQKFEIVSPEQGALTQPFQKSVATISPDGTELLFFGSGPQGSQLWLRRIDSLDSRPLPGTVGAAGLPFWSPDSRSVAFMANGQLKKLDVANGAVRVLCDLGGQSSGMGTGGFWTPDGRIVFSAEGSTGALLFEVSSSGGPALPVPGQVRPIHNAGNFSPVLLPDNRHFIYVSVQFSAQSPSSSIADIFVGTLDSEPHPGVPRRLARASFSFVGPPAVVFAPAAGKSASGYLLFTRAESGSGTLLAQSLDLRTLELTGEPVPIAEGVFYGGFSASASGVLAYRASVAAIDSQLTWYDRSGSVLGQVATPGQYGAPALSRDGSRVVTYRVDSWDLWLADTSGGPATRFTFGPSRALFPVWSPDGKSIIFASISAGMEDLYRQPVNGVSDAELLLQSGQNKIPMDVSRDGRFLLYMMVNPEIKYELWVLPLVGDKKPFPVPGNGFDAVDGRFSPDGHWIAYISDESGRYEIYVRRFSPETAAADSDSAGKWQVSYGGGVDPQWSADQKELYYLTPDSRLMAVNITTGSGFKMATPQLLFQLSQEPGFTAGGYTVDGKRFLFRVPINRQAPPPFIVVLNWQAALKP